MRIFRTNENDSGTAAAAAILVLIEFRELNAFRGAAFTGRVYIIAEHPQACLNCSDNNGFYSYHYCLFMLSGRLICLVFAIITAYKQVSP